MSATAKKDVSLKLGCCFGNVKKSFAIHLFAISLLSCGQYILMSLQTSLNVEDGLGATSMAIHFAVTLFAALISPAYLQFFSVKFGLVMADVAVFIYCLSNFHSKAYTLIPGSIIYGIGKASFWICSGSYLVFYAKLFAKSKGSTQEVYYNMCSGYVLSAMTSSQFVEASRLLDRWHIYKAAFWTFILFNHSVFELIEPLVSESVGYTDSELITVEKIIGSLITSFVFKMNFGTEDLYHGNDSLSEHNYTEFTTESTMIYRVSETCGAKDCQDPEVTKQTVSNYKPPNVLAVYLVMAIFSALALLGAILHFIYAPSEAIVSDTDENIKKRENGKRSSTYKPLPMDKVHFETNQEDCKMHHNNGIDDKRKKMMKRIESVSSIRDSKWRTLPKTQRFKTELVATLKQFAEPNQLLLMGLQFFTGFNKNFQFSDLTRAYTSCVYGVAQVGICLAIYNTSMFMSSVIVAKIAARYGRIVPICVAFPAHLATMMFCLFWTPTENSSIWVIIALYLIFGAIDSVWFATITASVASFFPDNSTRGYSCFITFITLANLVGFSWSTSLCVYVKIYIQIAALCIATTMQLIAERRLQQTKKCSACDEEEDVKVA